MSNNNNKSCSSDPRFVGDPIDVVTGAVTDISVDLAQRGPIPFRWTRYYSSARHDFRGTLGWGHSHEFEQYLCRDLDGIRLVGPLGDFTAFPDIAVGTQQARNGLVLNRRDENTYIIETFGRPEQEYRFAPGDEQGRLVCLRQARHSIELSYDPKGRLSEIVDSRGRLIRVTYNAAEQVVGLTIPHPSDPRKTETLLTYEYDEIGNLVGARDVFDTTQSLAYSGPGRLVRRTDRKGYSFHFQYDSHGRCSHSQGDDGLLEVRLEYSPGTNTTFVRRGDGGQWIYFYDPSGLINQVMDPYGNSTRYISNEEGHITQEIDPNGNVTVWHYDDNGQHDYRIDPNGHVIPARGENPNPIDPLAYRRLSCPLQWELGNLLSAESIALESQEVEPAIQTDVTEDFELPLIRRSPRFAERWKYDANGNLIEYRDRDGGVSRAEFDSFNALRRESDPLGNTTTYEHTAQGLVSKVIDPLGTATDYQYDLRDQLIEVRTQDLPGEHYQRDGAGNVIGRTDSQGRTLVRSEFGPGNVETSRTLASGECHQFQYDANGRIIAAVSSAGLTTFTYNEQGGLSGDLRDGSGVVHEFGAGQLSATSYFGKFKVTYRKDDDGDWYVTDPLGGEHRFTFGTNSSFAVGLYSNGVVEKYLSNGQHEQTRFDPDGRCIGKSLRTATTGQTWNRKFTYSPGGDLLQVDDSEEGITRYTYDAAHRLTEERCANSELRSYRQDAAGNLLLQPGLRDVTITAGNRLQSASHEKFTYNDRNHLETRTGPGGTISYHYNELDLLTRCTVNGEVWTAAYDALCRRVQKTWRSNTTKYFWDDFRLAAEVRHDGATRIYLYADEVALVPFMFIEYSSIAAEPSAGSAFFVFTDQIGTPVRVTNENGAICWKARLSPYGQAEIDPSSSIGVPQRFPGHFHDAEIRLNYNRFRYYSPELGRYLQSDPLGQAGGINVYAYPVCPLIGADLDGLAGTKVGPPPAPRRTGPTAKSPPAAGAGCPSGIPPGGIHPRDLVRSGAIVLTGSRTTKAGIMKDLNKIASTKTGQRVLAQIKANHERSNVNVKIRLGAPASSSEPGKWNRRDPRTGAPGQAFDSDVKYIPGKKYGDRKTLPSDVVLIHELDHAQRNGSGNNRKDYPNPDPSRFPNAEEHAAVTTENAYRRETGIPQRLDEEGMPSYAVTD